MDWRRRCARCRSSAERWYLAVVLICFSYVIYRFWQADVARLFTSGANMASSIEARFTIRERIGFLTFVPLQALLPYPHVVCRHPRGCRRDSCSGSSAACVEFFVLTVLLVMTNMKWPLLLFYVSLVLAIFVYGRQRAYLKAAVGTVAGVPGIHGDLDLRVSHGAAVERTRSR